MGIVYLIHFDSKYWHAQHYIGYTKNVELRLVKHRKGIGSKLLRAVNKAGISYHIVRIWLGDRSFERELHNKKHSQRLCPICKSKGGSL